MRKPWYSIFYIKSPIIKIGLGALAVLAGIVLVLFLMATENKRMDAQTASWNGRSIEKGASLFTANCSTCHGLDGKGLPLVAPALNSRYFFSQRFDDVDLSGTFELYVKGTIYSGRPSKTSTQWVDVMPTWSDQVGGPLREDQIDHLVHFVLNWEEEAMAQTPEEDPWQFFQDSLSKQLPYSPDEPGYDEKVAEAIAAAEAAGAVGYEIGGVAVEAPTQDEEVASAEVRDPEDLFNAMACAGCHNINADQTDDNKGPIAPNLGNLADHAGSRVEGEDAETYVRQSIIEPSAFVVSGYIDGVMPQNFADKMNREETQGLVEWMLSH